MSNALFSVPVSVNSNGDNTLIAGVAGRRIMVVGYVLMGAGTVTAKFTDGAGGTVLGTLPLTTTYPTVAPIAPISPVAGQQGWMCGTAGNALVMNLSSGVFAYGHISYCLVD